MIDVIILAGGFGRRLAGIWDGPKCLAPIGGRPVLDILLQHVASLRPGCVRLCLGHQAQAVIDYLHHGTGNGWLANIGVAFDRLEYTFETAPRGTAWAIREAMRSPLRTPLLVLNGDTVPMYSLGRLVRFHGQSDYATAAWHDGRNAGAAVLGSFVLSELLGTSKPSLDEYLDTAAKYRVSGYFDIGTPWKFHQAKHMRGDFYDSYADPTAG